MEAKTLEFLLKKYTVEKSNFDTHRNYISMSNILSSPEDLVYQYRKGYSADEKALLKCYKGYQMEADLVNRIGAIYGADFFDLPIERHYIEYDAEFETEDGLFKCHPDLMIDAIPVDCKSILMDEWLPEAYFKVSRKIKYQMQGQLLLSQASKAIIVYESRESGIIKCIDVERDNHIIADIKRKMEAIRLLLNI